MSELANQFSGIFREEHRAVRDALLDLCDVIMVERLSENEIRGILDARERCNAAGLDLLRWAREVRRRPTLPVA